MQKIYLNDLLGFCNKDIGNVKIRFNQFNRVENPLDVYIRDPETVNTRFFFGERNRDILM